jgi:hypothetical protein
MGVLRRHRQRPSKRHRRSGRRRRGSYARPRDRFTPSSGTKRRAGADVDAQLAQARKLEAKLVEEYRTVRLLRASMAGEASARGESVRELGIQARDRINADFNVDNPDTPPRASRALSARRWSDGATRQPGTHTN